MPDRNGTAPIAAARITSASRIVLVGTIPAEAEVALGDLIRDFESVIGTRPEISKAEGGALGASVETRVRASRVVRDGVPICDIIVAAPDDPSATGKPEAHSVRLEPSPSEGSRRPELVLRGSDTRGTIYAIYTVSQELLGVPPFWYWTGWEPIPESAISVPIGFERVYHAPYVRWRCLFPNDERMLRALEAKSNCETVPGAREMLCETVLRLKMNMLEVGALHKFPNGGEDNNALARARECRRRGIAVTNHHHFALGAGLRHWRDYWREIHNKDVPPLTMESLKLEDLATFYRDHIRWIREEDLEMLWGIGFRGTGDRPWYTSVENPPETDAERATFMRTMMEFQIDLLRKEMGANAEMRTQLYDEGASFFASGALRPPDDPKLIWSFSDTPFSHYPNHDIAGYVPSHDQPIGYYFHSQFTSTGAHLVQGEGPWKLEKNMRFVDDRSSRPVEFWVINAGNVREFALELSTNASLLYALPQTTADTIVKDFCAEYFGPEFALEIASLYRDYYLAFFEARRPDRPEWPRQAIFTDLRLMRAIEQLIEHLPEGYTPWPLTDPSGDARYFQIDPEYMGVETQLQALVTGVGVSLARFEALELRCAALWKAFSSSPNTRGHRFFREGVWGQIRYMRGATGTLYYLCRAMEARPREDARSQLPEILELLHAARRNFTEAINALEEGNTGVFAGWTDPEGFQLTLNFTKLEAMIEELSRRVY